MTIDVDILVYGGSAAGVTAAVQAARSGKTVRIVCPDTRLGGLTTGGLGYTDAGNTAAIGGMGREFYQALYQHYMTDEAWGWEARDAFSNAGQGTPALDHAGQAMWLFEPSVALAVLDRWIAEHAIPVDRDEWLDRGAGVTTVDGAITEIRTLSGKSYRAKVFIDATYEGDLMAAAGVSYHVGREANAVYGEDWNGVQTGAKHHGHYFAKPVDPYRIPGDPSSGLLPHISDWQPPANGTGDSGVQAYNYRVCMTDHPENRLPFPKPDGYVADEYELLLRVFATGWRETFDKYDYIPNRKTDTNNHGPFSSDFIGGNHDYPDATYARRAEIVAAHLRYHQGLLYFMQNDPRMPADVAADMQKWGLPKDEFDETGHWPHQLYIREARRLVGAEVMTEHEVFSRKQVAVSVGMGSYGADSHNVFRYVDEHGHVQNEGDIGRHPRKPYAIHYGSLTPKREECTNLLVPVCCSASHTAFGSIRMEPVFMILGQSAAVAAAMAIDAGSSVQDIPGAALEAQLLALGQRLRPAE